MAFPLETRAYINGKWVEGQGGRFPVMNPAIGEQIAMVTDCTPHDVQTAIDAASVAYKTWKKSTVKERSTILLKIHKLMLEEKMRDELATINTMEMGKTKEGAYGETGFAASFFEWFAEETRRQYGETIPVPAHGKRFITVKQPVGVVAMISPWNFPISMLGRKVSAALAAGCTCVLKPAEDTPLTALAFAKICEKAGVPPGVVNVVPCSRDRVQEVGALLCDSHEVQVLSFTGSTVVGKWLYSRCGNTVKKLSLELGGDAPFIIFPSADLNKVIKGAMAAKFRNCGQACISPNRFFVHESLHDEFVNRFVAAMENEVKLGNGLLPGVTLGPLINQKQHDRCAGLVRSAVSAGAKMVYQGKDVPGPLFYPPTLLTGVTTDNPIAQDEIFGPVIAIIKFKTEEDVVKMANDTERGLAGYFYSEDVSQIWRVAEGMEVGMVSVNEPFFSTCEVPFGGVKLSGLGKEGSMHGLDEYTHIKLICFGI
ncbi:unnamed protein product [Meganyctiphanes norvegica]|uniref:Aldehyde dehydrogenase domain-containing protein n=1 Tax=Meganyctiphanes norvegica TaxID=48144 RepID=A0AAV2R8H0_MEGNR